eukprot:993222-Lingulodinium_polyedra.AAC.1
MCIRDSRAPLHRRLRQLPCRLESHTTRLWELRLPVLEETEMAQPGFKANDPNVIVEEGQLLE